MKKKIVVIMSILVILFLVFILCIYILNTNKVAVLGYHGVMPRKTNISGNNLFVNSEDFEEQLKLLDKLGYKTLTLDEFYCWKNKKCKQPRKSILITFDDGYNNNYDYAYKLLKKYDMNAVVFYVGVFSESNDELWMNMDTINKVKEEYPNVEVASHSYNLHFHSDKTYDEVKEDAKKMSDIIDTKYYAYPFGDYNDEYIRALKDSGYKMAFTFGPKREHRKADLKDDNYTIPRLNISKDMPKYKFILRLLLPI